jgi:RNA polymerase sigma-70 factor (ECF subfamily)
MNEEARRAYAAALREGDPTAIDRLYRDNARAVLGWCVRLGAPGTDAEDAAHEVFVTALEARRAYRGDASVAGWLYQITRRVLANRRRRSALRRFFGLESAPEPSAAAEADVALGRDADRVLVQRSLARLPEQQREALVLVDLEERAPAQVAELLGVPVGTVHSRLFAARRAFAKAAVREGWAPALAGRVT